MAFIFEFAAVDIPESESESESDTGPIDTIATAIASSYKQNHKQYASSDDK